MGKNFASLVVELSRAGAAAAPDLDTEYLIPDSLGNRCGLDSLVRRLARHRHPDRTAYLDCTDEAKAAKPSIGCKSLVIKGKEKQAGSSTKIILALESHTDTKSQRKEAAALKA